MARSQSVDGAKSQATISAADTGDWTIAALIKPTDAGEANRGRILQVDNGSSLRQGLFFNDASLHLDGYQSFGTTAAFTVSSTTVATSAWSAVFATYTDSDKKVRLYIGTLSAVVAEASYSSQPTGSGTRDTGGTTATVFNNVPAASTFHGAMARVGFFNRLWRLDEMEAFRLGWVPPKDGNERGLWLFDSPTVGQVEDAYGVANATATSLTVAEDPPVPTWQSGEHVVLVQVAAAVPQTIIIGQPTETDTALAIAATQSRTIGQAVETDTAHVVTAVNAVPMARAVETDMAHAVVPVLMIGRAVETDTAHAVTPVPHVAPTAFLPPGITRPGRGPLPRRR